MNTSNTIISGPIGVDLDNTIVSYDEVLFESALDLGFIKPSNPKGKKSIRDAVRRLPEGEIKWQKLQAEIYGPRMTNASLIEGATNFFLQCKLRSIPVYIISHKTEFANYDSTRTNLRDTALDWLEMKDFFDQESIGLKHSNVYFESTRYDKIARIKSLCCQYFIDDLEETFVEATFPDGINKILFDQHNEYGFKEYVNICNTWDEITELIFGSNK